jgi:sigma-54 dependent transcriptional regulator, acetoin dehydrogenase operon transcriptional activator AcoR
VLVFGEDLTLANDVATARFDGAAQVVLRELGRQAGQRGSGRAVLPSGQELDFVCEPVPGTRQAHLVEVVTGPRHDQAAGPRTTRRARADVVDGDRLDAARSTRTPVLVTGEPGTGRSHVLGRLAPPAETRTVAGSDPAADGLLAELLDGDGLVVVDDVHLLTDVAAHRIAALLDGHGAVWFALTCGPETDLTVEQRALAARCPHRIALPPLRSRRSEVPSLALALLDEIAPGTRLAADAVQALIGWSWPGNLRELRSVLTGAAARCTHAVVTAADLALPQTSRPLTPLEQAEFDTIRAALRRHHGNKSHVAAELGIGRTTLYRRLREFGL